MKVRRILVLIAAAALAQVEYAKAADPHHAPPGPRSGPTVRLPYYDQLGAEQAVLDFCSRVDSGDAKQYGAEARTLVNGIGDDGLKRIRGSSQYKKAYAAIGSAVGRIPLQEAIHGCKDIIAKAHP